MAAVTITWDPTSPAGGDAISAGDDAIRAFKTGLVQRFNNGGHAWDASGGPTTLTTDGRHSAGASNTAGSGELAGEFNLYAADKTTVIATFRDSTAAANATSGNASGEWFAGALPIRSTGIVKGATVEVATLLRPAATADNTANDNAVDIGVATTNRFRDLFLGRNASIGGTLAVTGVATFTAVPVFSGGSSFTTLNVTTQFVLTGGSKSAIVLVTSGTYTVLATDHVILCDITAGSIVIQLPAASSVAGQDYCIAIRGSADSGSNFAAITPNGTDKISNINSAFNIKRHAANDRSGVRLISDGTNWHILSTYFLGADTR